jgi:hypothetical protein
MWVVELPWPASMAAATASARLIGIAKACVGPRTEPAVSMPTTCPLLSYTSPPESPGLSDALVTSSPVRCSALLPRSLAVIDAPSAVMDPVAAVGVPPLPPASPTQTKA